MDNSDSCAALDIKNILELYKKGVNITSYLKGVLGKNHNNEEIIETAYEAQAGSYLNSLVNGNSSEFFSACKERAKILDSIIKPFDVILDCGVGECTTLAGVFSALDKKVKLFGFDISLSRILMGKKTLELFGGSVSMDLFVAELGAIPFQDNSIDIVTTFHAMEPNHGREVEILRELLRVARRYLVLFEPSFEDNSEIGKKRMNELGYIRNLRESIIEAGGRLVDKIKLYKMISEVNPTYCYLVEPKSGNESREYKASLVCPISKTNLVDMGSYYYSPESYFAYPKIEGIPLLKKSNKVVLVKGL